MAAAMYMDINVAPSAYRELRIPPKELLPSPKESDYDAARDKAYELSNLHIKPTRLDDFYIFPIPCQYSSDPSLKPKYTRSRLYSYTQEATQSP